MSTTVEFETRACPVCGQRTTFNLDEIAYKAWRGGMFVQNAFPTMAAPVREQLITGTHPDCWDAL